MHQNLVRSVYERTRVASSGFSNDWASAGGNGDLIELPGLDFRNGGEMLGNGFVQLEIHGTFGKTSGTGSTVEWTWVKEDPDGSNPTVLLTLTHGAIVSGATANGSFYLRSTVAFCQHDGSGSTAYLLRGYAEGLYKPTTVDATAPQRVENLDYYNSSAGTFEGPWRLVPKFQKTVETADTVVNAQSISLAYFGPGGIK